MTAKEKAKELVDRFYLNGIKKYSMQYENSVQCALICVEEILRILPFTDVKYWKEVKEEINKL
tara:strand:- start:789 stop:977 length:189 start_codon:yes stop_codon:yes gene_type:complete